MATFLRREHAPLVDGAWALIDEQVARILKGNLSVRGIVDFVGPLGLESAALNLGLVKTVPFDGIKGVQCGSRQVLPLAEVRVPFALAQAELDAVARGARAPDLAPAIAAAQKAAKFEERLAFFGAAELGMTGMLTDSPHKPRTLGSAAGDYVSMVEDAVHAIQSRGIGGPFHLVFGRTPYQVLAAGEDSGYPVRKRVMDLLEGGSLRWSPALEGGAVVSGRGGDYELTVGQDFAIGFTGMDGDSVNLYILETLAFRVLEPAAAVELKFK